MAKRKAPFGAHFQAEHDRFADALGGLFPGATLADALRNGWALGHPHPVFIPVDCHEELHRRASSTDGPLLCAQRSRYQRSAGIRQRSLDGPFAPPAPMTRAATWQAARACVIPARARKLPSPKEVRQAIDAFVTVYSENSRSFEWRKAEVCQTTPQ